MTDKFYVYGLFDPENQEFIWIGKGSGNRVQGSKGGYDNYDIKERRVELLEKDMDLEVKMFKEGISEQEAFILERKLISEIGRACKGKGPLYNTYMGGGRSVTKESLVSKPFYKDNKEVSDVSVLLHQCATFDEYEVRKWFYGSLCNPTREVDSECLEDILPDFQIFSYGLKDEKSVWISEDLLNYSLFGVKSLKIY